MAGRATTAVSALIGWRFEDIDLQLRLQFSAGLTLAAAGEVLHLTHGDDTRGIVAATRMDDHRNNSLQCLENYRRRDFLGTYLDDRRTTFTEDVFQERVSAVAGNVDGQ